MNQESATRVMTLLMQGAAALQARNAHAAAASFAAARTVVTAAPGDHAAMLDGLDRIAAAAAQGDANTLLTAFAAIAPIIRRAAGDDVAFEAAIHANATNLGADSDARASALLHQGQAAHRNRDYKTAIARLTQALAISRAAPADSLLPGTILSALGAALGEAKDWPAAVKALREALAVKQRQFGMGNVLTAPDLANLATALEKCGALEEARALAEADLAIRRKNPKFQPADLALSLNGLATIASAQGDFGLAVQAYREALSVARAHAQDDAAGPALPIAGILDNLGLILGRLGDHDAAITHHLDALIIRQARLDARHPDIGRNLMHLGSAALRDRDWAGAAGYYRQALDIFAAQGPEPVLERAACLRNMAVLAAEQGFFAQSRGDLTAALAALHPVYGDNHPLSLHCQIDLAFAFFQEGTLAQAGGLARDVLRRAAAPGLASFQQPCWFLLALLADRENQPASSILFGKLAVNAIQRQRAGLQTLERDLQQRFADRHRDVFRATAGFLAKAGRVAEAGRVIKMLKEYELFELIRRDPALDPRMTFAELTALEATYYNRGDDLIALLGAIAQDIAALGADDTALANLTARRDAAVAQFDDWLRGAERACAAAHPAAPAMPLGATSLAARTALLQILPGAARLHLLLTTPEVQLGRDVALAEPVLNRLIHEFRVAIEHRSEDVNRLGRVLYDHLIAPVAGPCAAAGIETLAVSPVGSLRYLPFAALHDGNRFLAETMATFLCTEAAPGTRTKPADTARKLAGFGVTRELPGFRALYAVADELARIVRHEPDESGIFPGDVWLNQEFTAASLAAGLASHRNVHVASHFVFEPAAASGSYLLLGDGAHLNLAELASERFCFGGVDLLTLSACETAMGEQAGDGSEVEGFGALVRRRGVNAVVASLWPVEDASTPALMEHFYRRLHDGDTAPQALRAAQLHLASGADYRAPYFWAPFIVLGGAP
jgi:CHAT domain-containing protein